MKKSILKGSFDLLVDEKLEALLATNLKTTEDKEDFVRNAFNKALDLYNKEDNLDIEITVE